MILMVALTGISALSSQPIAVVVFLVNSIFSVLAYVLTEWSEKPKKFHLYIATQLVVWTLLLSKLFVGSDALLVYLIISVMLSELLRGRVKVLEDKRARALHSALLLIAMSLVFIDFKTNIIHPNIFNSGPYFEITLIGAVLLQFFFVSNLLYADSLRSESARLQEEQFVEYSAEFNNFFAHYINTPLTTAISNVDIAEFKLKRLVAPEVLEKVKPNFEHLFVGLENVSKTARELAYIHYLRSEVLREGFKPWHPEPLISGFMDKHDIELEIVLDEWEYVNAPQSMVEFTLDHIIQNALVYGAEGATPRVVVSRDINELMVSVFNVGNIPDFSVDVLKPFQRGINAKEGTGTGLGLSLVQDLKENYECHFSISNQGNLTRSQLVIPFYYRGLFETRVE